MKERTLRAWHRRLGMVLFVFVLIQALTGLYLSVPAGRETAHAHEAGSAPAASSHSHHGSTSRWAALVHHGGGDAGDVYRTILALALAVQAVSGAGIGAKIRARSRS
ncbi:hypothetical protein SAMN02745206_03449 [Desulfacinum infernum DSM 9756]|uniref:PepSY domain-containing protein n=1 Tax=Desulfacinum infernum DSM 9756 TaxID=1121391 RepID=A0A1M5HVI3_9BACT|nr:hypothetical protein [Desulfacinum infernum]SHG19934.1 hypothetical protein SAMN02745206_03449 [Desulfacinum infernum DSM 9756]